MATVRVLESCAVIHDGNPVALHKDHAYDSEDPIVLAFPYAFTDVGDAQVEAATANPGRKR